jgi:hypothetical protein
MAVAYHKLSQPEDARREFDKTETRCALASFSVTRNAAAASQ